MIRLPLNEVKSGMVLAKSIVSNSGDLLLAAGFVISDRILGKMRDMELTGCWIYEEGTEYVIPEEMINDQLALQAKSALRENDELIKKVMAMREVTHENVHKVMGEPMRFHNIIAVERFKSVVKEILDALMTQDPVAVNLNSLRSKSGYLYQHSLDVTITAILIAQHLKYPLKDIEELALGCLLMDTGMVILSDKIVNKKGPLNDEESSLLQEHAAFGYAILRENDRIPLSTAHVAYQHHERQDGTGYPRKLKGDNRVPTKNLSLEKGRIHRYAEIAAAADTYVSLIAPRPGTAAAFSPSEAVRSLIVSAGTHLNKTVVDTLVTLIPIYPVGSRVVVIHDRRVPSASGYSGVVAKCRMEKPDKPLILLLYDRDKKKIKPAALDLDEHPGIKIQFSPLQ